MLKMLACEMLKIENDLFKAFFFFVYVSSFFSVCVCVWEKERERERKRERLNDTVDPA